MNPLHSTSKADLLKFFSAILCGNSVQKNRSIFGLEKTVLRLAVWKLEVWASRAWWYYQKLEHLRETKQWDSMCSFVGATTWFEGATTCYCLLRPHLDFWGGILHIHKETMGLEGGISSLFVEGRKLWKGGGKKMKFNWAILRLFPWYLGGLFCSLWAK